MAARFLSQIEAAFKANEPNALLWQVSISGDEALPSVFAVSDLAAASFGAVGAALAALAQDGAPPPVHVDSRLASLWFGFTLQPIGWQMPGAWDPIAGDYRAADGWIRLHTNAPAHRAAALSVLQMEPEREVVARAVAGWEAAALEQAVVSAGGCAAEMRSPEAWATHEQGRAVAAEPLVHWLDGGEIEPPIPSADKSRPLAGVRVLDLTRVLAGPVATRLLAGFGAEVLRIDPPDWDEPGVIPEVTLGKRCAGLDLSDSADRETFEALLAGADMLVHGYRPGALEGLGYGAAARRALNLRLIEVSLNAYGWTGPWAGRRGFDSLVQMSSGIAAYGMVKADANKPVPLPVQALDQATGCLMAAAAVHSLKARQNGRLISARLSLARTAALLVSEPPGETGLPALGLRDGDVAPEIETTDWGAARRLRFPLALEGIAPFWPRPAGRLRTANAAWGEA